MDRLGWFGQPRGDTAAGRIAAAFAASLAASPASGAGLAGVEHEYRVLRNGSPLDFRELIRALGPGPAELDPGDRAAFRLPSGSALTSDIREAELVTPPAEIRPGFTARLATTARADRDWLAARLPAGVRLEGFTTHVSVSAPPALADGAAWLYAETFAPAMMLLLDRPPAPGLLVRPRANGRVELCGWYVDPVRLPSVLSFAVGSVRACLRHLDDPRAPMPPSLRLEVEPGVVRYGWYVDRLAAGPDLYLEGRQALLRTAEGRRIPAQEHFELAWQIARQTLDGSVAPDDVELAEAIVVGRQPLPQEGVLRVREQPRTRVDGGGRPGAGAPDDGGEALDTQTVAAEAGSNRTWRRPGFEVAPVMLTWDTAVFLCVGWRRDRPAFACVSRGYLPSFKTELEAGRLDAALRGYLRSPSTGRRLEHHRQTLAPGLWDELGDRLDLLPAERDPEG